MKAAPKWVFSVLASALGAPRVRGSAMAETSEPGGMCRPVDNSNRAGLVAYSWGGRNETSFDMDVICSVVPSRPPLSTDFVPAAIDFAPSSVCRASTGKTPTCASSIRPGAPVSSRGHPAAGSTTRRPSLKLGDVLTGVVTESGVESAWRERRKHRHSAPHAMHFHDSIRTRSICWAILAVPGPTSGGFRRSASAAHHWDRRSVQPLHQRSS